jgi:NAD(P)-dependent dehydrogenase (short-subunit alcohol dehydrogenase family)
MNKLSIAGFTNLGYRFHSRSFEPVDTDMTGKTVVITGASGGLGEAATMALTGLGARVLAVGRDRAKLDSVERRTDGRAVGIQADLSSMAEIRRLATMLLEAEPHLDVLINNVGVLLNERMVTDERIEATLATNLAGQFLLTDLLLPRLIESAPSRIVNVSSGGMYAERIHPEDLQFEEGEYRGASAYARTKRGQVILTEIWAERLEGTGVVVHAMHPGWARTEGVKTSLPAFNRLMRPLLRTPEQGADTIVWLAAADEPGLTSGQFWFDREVVPTHLTESTHETVEERQDLWDRLADLTGFTPPRYDG